MHGDSILLATFVIALVAAFLGGILARAARLPPVVGYLLGGLAVGPFTPGSQARSPLRQVCRRLASSRFSLDRRAWRSACSRRISTA